MKPAEYCPTFRGVRMLLSGFALAILSILLAVQAFPQTQPIVVCCGTGSGGSGGGSGDVAGPSDSVDGEFAIFSGTTGKLLKRPTGTGIALSTSGVFSVFSTSAGLLGALSDETGTGLAVFNNSPIIVTPTIASFVNSQHTHTNAAGGGVLSTSAISGTAVITSDARLSDARTPTSHASTHASAGSDPIAISESQVTNLVSDLASKQASGNYITALTGDVAASGPGSVAADLSDINSNVGTFTNATITVDAEGRISAASSGSSASPGGANTQVQFNDSGAFGGDAQLTFNKTSGLLSVTGASNDGSALADFLPGSGTSFVRIFNNGSVTIDGDAGTASVPLAVRSGAASRFVVNYDGNITVGGGNASLHIGAVTSLRSNGRIEAKGIGLVQTAVKTSAYTTAGSDSIVLLNPSGGGFTVTPSTANAAAVSVSGAHQVLILKNVTTSTNTITVTPSSGNIDNVVSLTMTTANGALRIFCDGTNWWTF